LVTSIVVAICFASILFAVGVFLLVMVKVSPHDDARQASFGVVMGVALITLGAIMLFLKLAPFDSKYYFEFEESGVVKEVSLAPGSELFDPDPTFVVSLEELDESFVSRDPRFRSVVPGDTVTVTCFHEWNPYENRGEGVFCVFPH